MINYSTKEIATIVGAKLIGNPELVISEISVDSRSLSGNETLFVAIVGERHDGHTFIEELVRSHGLRVFLVSKELNYEAQFPEASFLLVDNTLTALQKLAAFHRRKFNYPVVGITGSNGKTIIKEWLNQLLASDLKIVRSPKSYNSQVGVPLSVLLMDSSYQLGIFEAGISMPQEMNKLEQMITPDIGIFSNVGSAHQENFRTMQEKAQEKLKLFINAKTLIYCKDHSIIDNLIKGSDNISQKLFTWGVHKDSNILVERIDNKNGSTIIYLKFQESSFSISIPFSDKASIENAMHCLTYMIFANIKVDTIARRMEKLSQVAMRLELKEGINGCTLINDSYNSDLGSLTIALDFLLQQKQHSKRLLIISDILQSGKSSSDLYNEVSKLVSDKRVDKIIGIGSEISKYNNLFSIESEFYQNTKEFLSSFSRRQISNTAILLKGSRNFHFEQIAAMLEQKAHRTILEINMNALVHNLNYFRGLLHPGVRVMAMVKAFSYGSGSFEIANLLQFHRIDYLGVAFADEGVALRDAGISLPIIVLNPSFGTYELMVEYNLEPEVYNFSGLKEFIRIIDRSGIAKYGIHIKLDTGMHRLGFTNDQLDELIRILKESKSIEVKSIFSHLAASEDSLFDSFTKIQLEAFEASCSKIAAAIGYQPIRHILNSAGIERFPEAQFEMVRLGIGLYGVSSIDQGKLQNVSTLKTKVIQVKQLNPGETVGYNRKGLIEKPSTIVTIPIGYADGLSRRLSNGVGKFMLNGKLVPTIGNISMDTCMLDATGVQTNEGDEVVIFGKQPTIFDIASAIESIPYEVLTSISRRVKRIYYQE